MTTKACGEGVADLGEKGKGIKNYRLVVSKLSWGH